MKLWVLGYERDVTTGHGESSRLTVVAVEAGVFATREEALRRHDVLREESGAYAWDFGEARPILMEMGPGR